MIFPTMTKTEFDLLPSFVRAYLKPGDAVHVGGDFGGWVFRGGSDKSNGVYWDASDDAPTQMSPADFSLEGLGAGTKTYLGFDPDPIAELRAELASVRRLLDGVKDAVCDWAKKLDSFGFIGGKPQLDAYGSVCRIIAAAQQPAPSGEGTPITIDPAASAAADTNAATTKAAVSACQPWST